MKKVFIDGEYGTTGLRLKERLKQRSDIQLLEIGLADHKNDEAKKALYKEADIVFLCLPDEAAKNAVQLVDDDTIIIDTSTYHRTTEGWLYGFPELFRDKKESYFRNSRSISIPGCHASGFISLIRPLVDAGVLNSNTELSCFSITGYSGGGKKMINQYESELDNKELISPRQYGITQNHKHLPEMRKYSCINISPVFCPIVSNYYSGMEVTVPLRKTQMSGAYFKEDLKKIYSNYYFGKIVQYNDKMNDDGFISSNSKAGKDSMEINVTGNDDRILLVSRFDNLGKGSSGAALQCLNLVMGCDEEKGLVL